GALHASGANVTLRRTLVQGNVAEAQGGAVYLDGGNLDVENCTFQLNVASKGGVISVPAEESVIRIAGSLLSENTVTNNGGVILVESAARLSVSNSAFQRNTANAGGVLRAVSSVVEFFNCSFEAMQVDNGGVLYITQDVVGTMSNCIFHACTARKGGVAMLSSGSQLEIFSSLVHNNTAEQGAVVYVEPDSSPSRVDIQRTVLVDNTAVCGEEETCSGDDVCLSQGSCVVIRDNSSLSMDNCTVTGNVARHGGVIYLEHTQQSVITDTLFEGNAATEEGGVISIALGAMLNASDCIFEGNNASAGGGVLYAYSSPTSGALAIKVSVLRSRLSLNAGTALEVTGQGSLLLVQCVAEGNSGDMGGVTKLSQSGGEALLHECAVHNNTASYGSVMYLTYGNATLTSCAVRGNRAMDYGGVAYSSSNVMVVEDSVVKDNVATLGGGVVYASSMNLMVRDSELVGNQASENGGVALQTNGGTITFILTLLELNVAGVGSILYYLASTASGSLTLLQTRVLRNSASTSAGLVRSTGKLWVYQSVVAQNTGVWGQFYLDGASSEMRLEDSLVAHNRALGGAFLYSRMSGRVEIVSSNLTDNIATNEAGVAYFENQVEAVLVQSSTISRNVAGKSGAVMFFTTSNSSMAANMSIVDSMVASNEAAEAGGFMSADYQVNLNIVDSHFVGNSVLTNGGCFHLYASYFSATRSTFANNSAKEMGGVIYLQNVPRKGRGTFYLDECLLSSNEANYGSTHFLSGTLVWLVGRRCRFAHNRATTTGAIHVQAGQVQLQASVLAGNTCAESGAAIYATSSAHISFLDVEIVQNEAEMLGGGIFAKDNSSIHLHNSTLSFNWAGDMGGGLYVEDGVTLFGGNVTMEGNMVLAASGEGGALAALSSELNLVDSHLVNNSALHQGGAVCVNSLSTLLMRGSVVANNTVSLKSGGGISVFGSDCQVLLADSLFEGNVAREWDLEAESLGGGIYFHLDGDKAKVSVVNSRFARNVAALGGGLYMEGQQLGWEVLLENLSFSAQAASSGGCMYWVYVDDKTLAPECVNCICDTDFASSIVVYTVQQGDGDTWVTAENITVESGVQVQPSLRYLALDHYGTTVQARGLELYVRAEMNAVESDGGVEHYITGSSAEEYGVTGATFSDLKLSGSAGRTYCLSLAPASSSSRETWAPVEVYVTMRMCEPGERYTESLHCERCPEGFLKFDNSSTPCTECTISEDIECLGGNKYTIKQGAWVSPGVEKCSGVDETVEECFMSHIYTCNVPERCESDYDKRVHNNVDVSVGLDLCRDGHRRDVVMCGSCEDGFQTSFTDVCHQCSDTSLSVFQVTVICFAVSGILYVLWFALINASRANMMSHLVTTRDGKSKGGEQQVATATFMSIMFGYMQIMGPTIEMFGDLIPTDLREIMTAPFALMSLPLEWMLQLSCIIHKLSLSSGDTSASEKMFYRELAMKGALPYLVVVVFGGLFLHFHHLLRKTRDSTLPVANLVTERKRGDQDSSGPRRKTVTVYSLIKYNLAVKKGACVAAMTFLLVFLYPTVGLQMFRVYHCDLILHDAAPGTTQYWLRNDRTVQCFVGDWVAPAIFCTFTILIYILGFPSAVAIKLHHLYLEKKYEVQHSAELTHQSQEHKDWEEGLTAHIVRRRNRRHSHPQPSVELLPAGGPISCAVHRAISQQQDLKHQDRGEVAWCTPGSLQEDQQRFAYAREKDVWVDKAGRLTAMMDGKAVVVRPAMVNIVTRKGTMQLHASRLQDPRPLFYWGRFYVGCVPRLYFFNCIALLRRLFQTGMVVVVQILSPRYDLVYALSMSVFAVILQMYYR
ncbi:hypothetical protein CYMTET_50123, partial [Cymbomonas tetramitiformis]